MLPSINKHDHFCGNVNSKIVFVIYEDYECEDCGRAYRELKKLLEYFTENICIVYRQFPLFNMHPSAFLAALTAEAGTQYNKFNEIRDLILENQECLEYGLGGIWHLLEKEHILSKEQL